MPVTVTIPELGNKFQDYRDGIPGDSYNWGPTLNASQIKYFAFHHSVTAQTAKNDGNWKAECNKIANLHLGQGWGGVGYRFIIASDGTVAYVGDLSRGGSAVTGNNHIIISACLVGDFTKELPTAAQIHSSYILQKFFREKMPQYPLIVSEDSIIGHQDAYALLNLPGATATACPGSNWRASGGLRWRYLNDQYQGYPNPQPTNPTPQPEPTPIPPPSSPGELEEQLKEANRLKDLYYGQLQDSLHEISDLKQEVVRLKADMKFVIDTIYNSSISRWRRVSLLLQKFPKV